MTLLSTVTLERKLFYMIPAWKTMCATCWKHARWKEKDTVKEISTIWVFWSMKSYFLSMTSKSWNFASEKENVANPIEEAVISKINHVKLWLNTISCKDSTLQGLCQCCSESCCLHEPELCPFWLILLCWSGYPSHLWVPVWSLEEKVQVDL